MALGKGGEYGYLARIKNNRMKFNQRLRKRKQAENKIEIDNGEGLVDMERIKKS